MPLMERLLPRHMQIIYLINALHLDAAARQPAATTTRCSSSVSLIEEDHGRRVRMGHLAFVGSHKVNGVSALHTDLMKQTVFRDLDTRSIPDRIVNKTNGITFRRWLLRGQSRPDRAARRRRRRRRCWTTPTRWRSSSRCADDAALPRALRRGQAARTRRRSPRLIAERARRRASIPTRCSTCRSSASTNTSASCSTSSRRSRSTTRSAPSRRATGCRG